MKKIAAVIPAYYEEERTENVINRTKHFVAEIILIDDCSYNQTSCVVGNAATKILQKDKDIGYNESIEKGFKNGTGDIIITLDVDGEYNSEEISDLLKPILNGVSDLDFKKRKKISRISES